MIQICDNDALIEGKLLRLLRLDAEGYDYIGDPAAAIGDIRSRRIKADLFTFVQRPFHNLAGDNFYRETDNFACLSIASYDEWFNHKIDFKARNKARKAPKAGIVIQEVEFNDSFVEGISAIYNESPVRQGRQFWHYQKPLDQVRKMNATFMERSIFIGAFLEGRLIGFIKMVTSRDGRLAGLMQILSLLSQRDKAPTNALVAQAVKSCADRGIEHLLYANFSYGNKQLDGLAEFKRANGFEKVEVARYFVPLTLKGAIALRLGLHRDAKNLIPEPLAANYRKLRASWNSKKLPKMETA